MTRSKTDKAEREFAEIITDAHRKSGLSNKEFAARLLRKLGKTMTIG